MSDKTSSSQEELISYPFPFAPNSLTCPVQYEQLRQECPVAHVKMPFGGNAYVLTRHADVTRAFTDPNVGIIQVTDGDVPRREAGPVVGSGTEMASLFSVSDARHNHLRRLVTQMFTVKHANELAPQVAEVTNRLIDAMEKAGPPADLFEDYAIQTPMTIICELLGVPREDEQLFREWGGMSLSKSLSREEKRAGMQRMVAYLNPIIERERAYPGENVLGLLVKAREKGDDVITQQEVLTFAIGLIAAGFETVSTSFTNSAFLLLQRPDLIEQLKERLDDPVRMTAAIDEILRITPIGNGGRPRITRGTVTYGDVSIDPGEVLMLDTLAANRDEAVFPDPQQVDFDRIGNQMLSFGRGIHSCIGQQIARMELRVLWTTLLKRLPSIRLAVPPSEVPWRSSDSSTQGPAHLPVTW